jgi:hypothetical protein
MTTTGSHRLSRRAWLRRSAGMTGACAGYGLAERLFPLFASPNPEPHPLAARAPHFAPRAKRVIMFFLTGGMSHVDSFDPKPELAKRHGEKFGRGTFLASPWAAQPRGRSGIVTTDLFPRLNGVVDDLCVIRSMHGDQNDHFEATLHMHTGSQGSALPGLGAWVSYGLGTENPNLPSHVVFCKDKPYAGAQVWDSNFLPAYHQGVNIVPGDDPIPHLRPHADNPWSLQQAELEMLRRVNERHRAARPHDGELAARMLSFQTAASLERIAPDLLDLRDEPQHTLDLYGLQRGDNRSFAWQTLVARRMAEAGVRFIELIDTGASGNWDAHGNIKSHANLAGKIDRPIAGLVQDLKQRGLLEDTLVIFTTEFGRTPDGTNGGRNHHCRSFTCWMAGGGVKPGHIHGATNDIGNEVAEQPVHVHDFHATILHLLGLNHEHLTFHHAGRDFRLTDVFGNVVKDILL